MYIFNRTSTLPVSERDFERFKFTFRDFTTDREPEKLLFRNLWPLMASIGAETGFDEEGNPIETPLSPPVPVQWGREDRLPWKYAIGDTTDSAPKDAKEFLLKFYNEDNSFLTKTSERVGLTFEDYWAALLKTPARFDCACVDTTGPWAPNVEPTVSLEAAQWEAYRLMAIQNTASDDTDSPTPAGIVKTVTFDVLKWVVTTLRFRMKFDKLLMELKFQGDLYIDPNVRNPWSTAVSREPFSCVLIVWLLLI